jgi:ketosteroid isomerase-like protein
MDSILAFFSEDAVIYPANHLAVEGKPAIRAFFEDNRAQPGFSLTTSPFEAHVSESGDLGYTLGNYEFRFDGPGGSPTILPGVYLSVWQKMEDGTWKTSINIHSPEAQLLMAGAYFINH